MSKDNLTTGLSLQNRQIFEASQKTGKWIGYNKKWYTCTQFAREIGRWEINIAHVQLEDPLILLEKGRKVIEQMIIEGNSKPDIIAAIRKLHAFTDQVRLYHPPSIHEYKQ